MKFKTAYDVSKTEGEKFSFKYRHQVPVKKYIEELDTVATFVKYDTIDQFEQIQSVEFVEPNEFVNGGMEDGYYGDVSEFRELSDFELLAVIKNNPEVIKSYLEGVQRQQAVAQNGQETAETSEEAGKTPEQISQNRQDKPADDGGDGGNK